MDCSKKDLVYYGNEGADKKRLSDIEQKLFDELNNFHVIKEAEYCKSKNKSTEIFRNLFDNEEYDYFKNLQVTILLVLTYEDF